MSHKPTEMEVRVARALAVADRVDPDAASLVGMKTMRCWEARLPQARVAIRAMREPTDEMMVTHNIVWPSEWQEIIDAASPPDPTPSRGLRPHNTSW